MAELVLYNKMKAAIEKCQSIDEIKEIRDKAEALRQYSKIAGDSEAMNKCAAIKIQGRTAEQVKILKDMDLKPWRPQKSSHDGSNSLPYGVTWSDSSRWQRLTEIPQEKFEDFIEKVCRTERRNLTTADSASLGSVVS